MAKQSRTLELALPDRDRATPAYRWLYDCVRSAILSGRLRPGSRLPSTRDLGVQYGLSRGTIVLAFDHLASEGYVEGSVGSGTYVTRTLPDDLLRVAPAPAAGRPPERLRPRRLSAFARGVAPFPGYEARPSRAFRANVPALDLFPMTLWTKVAARRLRAASANLLLGAGPTGYRPLQEAISAYLREARGAIVEPAQLVITSGVQDALDLAARLVLDRGDRVCMEDPGYPGAARAFEAAGARVHGAPVDGEGMTLGAGLRGARLIYVTPAHQFPLGTTMSLGRRLELLAAARRTGALVFEDDYDSEFRYSGRPVPALQGLDRDSQVLFAGSFSKVLFPALRLGYLVVPPDLVDRVSATRSVTGRPPHLEQAVLCDFITAGHFARHLRRMRQVYADRLEVLLEEARARLGGLLEISPIQAGLQTAGWLRGGKDGEAAARAAAARGLEVTPLARYSRSGRARAALHLGFAALDGPEIRRGVRELAVALEAMRT